MSSSVTFISGLIHCVQLKGLHLFIYFTLMLNKICVCISTLWMLWLTLLRAGTGIRWPLGLLYQWLDGFFRWVWISVDDMTTPRVYSVLLFCLSSPCHCPFSTTAPPSGSYWHNSHLSSWLQICSHPINQRLQRFKLDQVLSGHIFKTFKTRQDCVISKLFIDYHPLRARWLVAMVTVHQKLLKARSVVTEMLFENGVEPYSYLK